MKRKEQVKELKGLDKEALTKRVQELSHELMNLRFRKSSSQLTSSARITQCKREIARAKTLMAQAAK
jgi:large subunit ribosomal protein L29